MSKNTPCVTAATLQPPAPSALMTWLGLTTSRTATALAMQVEGHLTSAQCCSVGRVILVCPQRAMQCCAVGAGTGCCALRSALIPVAVLSVACGWCICGAKLNIGTNISNAGQALGRAGFTFTSLHFQISLEHGLCVLRMSARPETHFPLTNVQVGNTSALPAPRSDQRLAAARRPLDQLTPTARPPRSSKSGSRTLRSEHFNSVLASFAWSSG